MLDLLQNEWFLYALAGFGANGFITQAVALTPTKRDDKALTFIGVLINALTGTFGLTRKN